MAHAASRFTGLIASSVALLILAACGGGEDELPGGAPDALATPEQVRAQLTFVIAHLPLPRLEPTVAPTPFTCTSGGSREVTEATVASPFLASPLPVERVAFTDCMQYSGPDNDPQSSFARRHGMQETGALPQQPNGTRIRYEGDGVDAATPLELQLRSALPNGVYEEDHFLWRRLHHSERTTFFGLFRRSESRIATRRELSIRYPDGARFEGSYRFGSDTEPVAIESRNGMWKVNGQYAIETALCQTGTLQVQTVRDLAFDEAQNRFVGGRLRFSMEGASAEAEFGADGQVRLTGAQGQQLQEPWQPGIQPWNSECFAATEG